MLSSHIGISWRLLFISLFSKELFGASSLKLFPDELIMNVDNSVRVLKKVLLVPDFSLLWRKRLIYLYFVTNGINCNFTSVDCGNKENSCNKTFHCLRLYLPRYREM